MLRYLVLIISSVMLIRYISYTG